MPPGDVIQRILIIRFSSMGDIVMATPMIRCLRQRFPKSQIDMVVKSDFLPLIAENPHLDQKIGLDQRNSKGLFALACSLRRENYDLIYDAHTSLRSLVLTMLLRPRFRARFKKRYFKRALALSLKLPLMKDWGRLIERYIEPLTPFGVQYDGGGPECFPNTHPARKPRSIKVGIIPSAQWPGKRWPFFHDLLSIMVGRTDWSLTVFGGPNDHFCKALIQDLTASRVVNWQGLPLGRVPEKLSECDFVVANDTGLVHLSDALGIPCVLILGPTSRELGCLPFHPMSRVVERNDLWCRPCSKNGQAPCIRGKRHCLDIPASRVFEEASALATAISNRHPAPA